ncbi:2-Hydroxyacid oxidase 1-like [Uloborus diversus]|uniref:2-Hydroxyacid oxidase 1-like n=1 Tax=Uloborus diversus TaxID=327109 RepID=UPI00240909AF|nr:2-Hydroxyacid oxidase 1-like [Uloborus diversus]
MKLRLLFLFVLSALSVVYAAPDGAGIGADVDVGAAVDVGADVGVGAGIDVDVHGDDSSVFEGPGEWDDNCDCRLGDNAFYDDILYLERRYQDFVCVEDFRQYAYRQVDAVRFNFFTVGSENETTAFDNVDAYDRLRLRPRVLRGVGVRDTTTRILGDGISFPLGISPIPFLEYADPDGEIGVAEAAECEGVPYIVSALANTDLEDVAARAPHANLWMETYIFKDRSITQSIVERAEAAGYRAIVVTISLPVAGTQVKSGHDRPVLPDYLSVPNIENDESNVELFGDGAYLHRHHILAEIELIKGRGYFKTQKVNQKFERYEKCIGSFGLDEYLNYLIDPEQNWEDFRWITTLTDLPIVIRGVVTGCDAIRAVESGAAAVMVSNSGGYGLDSAPATIEALAEVSEALDVYPNVEIFVEGGVRWGHDIIKALALGADAVFVQRPVSWAMLHSGKCGVRRVLSELRNQLDRDMALMGVKHVEQITSTMVVNREYYRHRYHPNDVDSHSLAREDVLECPFGYDYDEGSEESLEDVNQLNDPNLEIAQITNVKLSRKKGFTG